ncbi:MAG: hypothetical protein ABJ327_12155 [Litoreibacter sp.]
MKSRYSYREEKPREPAESAQTDDVDDTVVGFSSGYPEGWPRFRIMEIVDDFSCCET